jgi:hypothetical protein
LKWMKKKFFYKARPTSDTKHRRDYPLSPEHHLTPAQ